MSWLINMLSEVSDAFFGDAEMGERNDRNERKAGGNPTLTRRPAPDREPRRDNRRDRDSEDGFDHFW